MKHEIAFETEENMYAWIQENFPDVQGDRKLSFTKDAIFIRDPNTFKLIILLNDKQP